MCLSTIKSTSGEIDLSLIIALAALLFSVISPIISEFIRARHARKMFVLENIMMKDFESVSCFLRDLACLPATRICNYSGISTYTYQVLKMCSNDISDLILEFMKQIDYEITMVEEGSTEEDVTMDDSLSKMMFTGFPDEFKVCATSEHSIIKIDDVIAYISQQVLSCCKRYHRKYH